MGSSSPIFGVNIKKICELPPPSTYILYLSGGACSLLGGKIGVFEFLSQTILTEGHWKKT